ncbi:MAG: hypothetical protein NVSMB5_26380 [Candidatus Velthaea sp.]
MVNPDHTIPPPLDGSLDGLRLFYFDLRFTTLANGDSGEACPACDGSRYECTLQLCEAELSKIAQLQSNHWQH